MGERIFLFGEQPIVVDSFVYHYPWFIHRTTAAAGILGAYPEAVAWMHRVATLDHSQA